MKQTHPEKINSFRVSNDIEEKKFIVNSLVNKSVYRNIFLYLFALLLLIGCRPIQAVVDTPSVISQPRVKALLADLDARGIKLTAPTISYDPGLSPSPGIAYARRSDYFAIHIAANPASATQLENQVRTFVDDLRTGKNGLDMAGSIRYYRCDLVFVAYLAEWSKGPNSSIEQALVEACGPEIAHYPA